MDNLENHIQFSIGWGTLSLIVAGIAQGKNRSGLLWWLFSLFFGPLALLILLLVNKLPEPNVIEARVVT